LHQSDLSPKWLTAILAARSDELPNVLIPSFFPFRSRPVLTLGTTTRLKGIVLNTPVIMTVSELFSILVSSPLNVQQNDFNKFIAPRRQARKDFLFSEFLGDLCVFARVLTFMLPTVVTKNGMSPKF